MLHAYWVEELRVQITSAFLGSALVVRMGEDLSSRAAYQYSIKVEAAPSSLNQEGVHDTVINNSLEVAHSEEDDGPFTKEVVYIASIMDVAGVVVIYHYLVINCCWAYYSFSIIYK